MCVYGGPALKRTREMELKHLQSHTQYMFFSQYVNYSNSSVL